MVENAKIRIKKKPLTRHRITEIAVRIKGRVTVHIGNRSTGEMKSAIVLSAFLAVAAAATLPGK